MASTSTRRPGPRGWAGRGRGRAVYVQAPAEFRATTVQACGVWPFSAGSGSPMVGVPLGRNLLTGATVCCDPISWFMRAQLISNPSAFELGLPGIGKSSVGRRLVVGCNGYGALPMIVGDLKPDYVSTIEALGGQVIDIGPGVGALNVLDPGEATEAAQRLTGRARAEVLADAHARRTAMMSALITIQRGAPPRDREESIIDRALLLLDDRHKGVPIIPDLLQAVRDGGAELSAVAIDRGDRSKYERETEDLEASLAGLCGQGRLGATFARHTTTPQRRDLPVVYNVSRIDDSQTALQGAALMACWSAGFGVVNVANALADAGLEPRRHYFVVMDELWRALRAGRGMVDRIDALTRLNRQRGVGTLMITHTMSDLQLPDPADTAKARGFVERAGIVIAGGLPASEMPLLRSAVAVSRAEEDLLTSWTDPPAWNTATGQEEPPPGRGKFLIKVGGRPGIPIQVQLTEAERALNDTNHRWRSASRISLVKGAA